MRCSAMIIIYKYMHPLSFNMDTHTEQAFFKHYIIEKMTKTDIQTLMDITERQYFTLVQIAKSMDKTDITLDDYLLELNRQYIICDDNKTKIDLLKLIGNIVERKHKIPSTVSILDVEV